MARLRASMDADGRWAAASIAEKAVDQGPGWHGVAIAGILRALPGNTIDRANRRTPPPTAGILSQRQAPNLALWDRQSRSLLRLRRVVAHRPTMTSRRHAPAVGGTTHRHRVLTTRCSGGTGGRSLASSPERHPAGVIQVDPSDRHRPRDRAGRFDGRGQPHPRCGGRDEGRRDRRTGRLEHSELQGQREALREPGPLLWRQRDRDLQPECDVVAGQGGGPGRERPHLPRTRQRVAKPVRRVLEVHQGRVRAQPDGRQRATTTPSIGASTTSTRRSTSRPTPWSS